MVCPSCMLIPLGFIGIGSTFVNLYVGLLLTIVSCALYIHFKKLTKKPCTSCR